MARHKVSVGTFQKCWFCGSVKEIIQLSKVSTLDFRSKIIENKGNANHHLYSQFSTSCAILSDCFTDWTGKCVLCLNARGTCIQLQNNRINYESN